MWEEEVSEEHYEETWKVVELLKRRVRAKLTLHWMSAITVEIESKNCFWQSLRLVAAERTHS